MTINPFLNSERQLRSGWWILIFFLVLAAFLVPMIIMAQENKDAVSMGMQALIILLASFIGQLLRRKPLAELLGKFNGRWFKELCVGGLIGSAIVFAPAFIPGILGWVEWRWNPMILSALLSGLLFFARVAAAEELLFRGFVFQRLISGLGQCPAQLITAAFSNEKLSNSFWTALDGKLGPRWHPWPRREWRAAIEITKACLWKCTCMATRW